MIPIYNPDLWPVSDLSTLMQIITKDERYRPNIRKNAIIRHIASPASQDTVTAHPISSGIIRNVTYVMIKFNVSLRKYLGDISTTSFDRTLLTWICYWLDGSCALTKRSAIDKCITRVCIRDFDFRFRIIVIISTVMFPAADINIRIL